MGNLQCGGSLTEECLGDTDIRYDASASDQFVDQSVVWQKMSGYFKTNYYLYGSDYQPLEALAIAPFLSTKSFPQPGYENFTIDAGGTRIYQHNYVFGENINPDGPGFLMYTDSFKHTSYERDGSGIVLPYITSFADYTNPLEIPPTVSYPVGNSSLLATGYAQSANPNATGFAAWIETKTCLDDPCDKVALTIETFLDGVQTLAMLGFQTRITESEFISGMNQAYVDYRVQPSMQLPIPMETACNNVQQCHSEEYWCESGDPSCSESPYQEPDGKVKPGVISGFTVAGFVLLLAAAYAIHVYLIKKRDERNRIMFATRVAQTMSIKKSMRSLTPAMLEKEFNKIDNEHGGRITKEALWEFLNSGKAGEINERDFESLWAVMHGDDSNTVDFLEFCAYMAQCQDEYNAAARANRGSIAVAASLARISVARSLSAHFSEGLKGADLVEEGQKAVEEEPEVKAEDPA